MTSDEALLHWIARPPTWDDLLEWIGQSFKGPVIAEGVLTADDARRAVDHGSVGDSCLEDHGGRQLDGAPATFAASARHRQGSRR